MKKVKINPLDYEIIEKFAFKYPLVERGVNNSYYSKRPLESKIWWKRLELMLGLAVGENHEHVIDLGGGYGFLVSFLAKMSRHVYYIDFDINHVNFANDLFNELGLENVHVIAGDIQHLPFRDNSFQTMFAADVLEHIENLQSSIEEMNRTLSKDGQIVTTSPSENRLYLFLRLLRKGKIREETHLQTERKVVHFLSKIFDRIEIKKYPPVFELFTIALYKKR